VGWVEVVMEMVGWGMEVAEVVVMVGKEEGMEREVALEKEVERVAGSQVVMVKEEWVGEEGMVVVEVGMEEQVGLVVGEVGWVEVVGWVAWEVVRGEVGMVVGSVCTEGSCRRMGSHGQGPSGRWCCSPGRSGTAVAKGKKGRQTVSFHQRYDSSGPESVHDNSCRTRLDKHTATMKPSWPVRLIHLSVQLEARDPP
jgi:hypothetical protein